MAQVCIGVGITQVQTTFKEFYNLDNSFATDGSQFDYLIKDKESLALGSLNIVALHTPGHTPDHTAYQIGDAVFIGDSLFMVSHYIKTLARLVKSFMFLIVLI